MNDYLWLILILNGVFLFSVVVREIVFRRKAVAETSRRHDDKLDVFAISKRVRKNRQPSIPEEERVSCTN